MGHLEACAAAAGLASLLVTPLIAGLVPTNAQLRRFSFLIAGALRSARACERDCAPQAKRTPRVAPELYRILHAGRRGWTRGF